jgi:hypothetical protein
VAALELPPNPRATGIAPTTVVTMLLRIRLVPRAASQPIKTLAQLVPEPPLRLLPLI